MMNYTILLFILNLILLARLRLIFRDDGATQKDLLIITGLPMLALLFLQINLSWFLLLVYLLLLFPLLKLTEKATDHLYRNRLLILLLHIVVLTLFCSPLMNLNISGWPQQLLQFVNRVMLPGSELTVKGFTNFQILFFGLLTVINEMNLLLRYLLQSIDFKSLPVNDEFDGGEYNTGRLIGMLERIFVFLFVLFSQYTAIGFILAAKGVARFPDFKSRTFAEYVLIGTLLSTLLALAIGYFVKLVL